jgi:phosphoglycolate phosphatase-like HAD superfamily hydrolase
MFVFDFDGVLADSSALCLDLLRRVQAQRSGAPVAEDFWDRLDDISFPAMAQGLGIAEEERAGFVERVFAAMAGDAYRPALFDGIAAVLRTLASQRPIAILSASPLVVIEQALKRAGVSRTVRAIRDGGDPIGKAAKLPGLLAQFGVPAERAVMVGDAVSDVRAGQANGMCTAAVTWGWQSRARLKAAGPDWLLTRVDALMTLPELIDARARGS